MSRASSKSDRLAASQQRRARVARAETVASKALGRAPGEKRAKLEKAKHAGGRPSSFTQGIADTICDLLSSGTLMCTACEDLGIPMSTFMHWRATNAEFSKAVTRAREQGAEALVAKARAVLEDAAVRSEEVVYVEGIPVEVRHDGALVTAAANLAHHYKWEAKALKPREYGDKVQIDQKSEVLVKDERDSLRDKVLAAAEGVEAQPPSVH